MVDVSSRLEFVPGVRNPEDLVLIPGTRWIIASGMSSVGHPQGCLHLVDTASRTAEVAFPNDLPFEVSMSESWGLEPPALDSFSAHGLSLRPGADPGGVHELYVVNHGGRESIEVFSVDATGDRPVVTWRGAIAQDDDVSGNGVAVIPGGGLVSTKMFSASDPHIADLMHAGEITGNVKRWSSVDGWSDIPGTELSGPNGVEVSPDGRWLFVMAWSSSAIVRVALGTQDVVKDTRTLDFLPDNAKWGSDGRLIVAGHVADIRGVFEQYMNEDICSYPSVIVRVDPESFEVEEVARFDHPEFGTATTAIDVGDELWIGGPRCDRMAYLPAIPEETA